MFACYRRLLVCSFLLCSLSVSAVHAQPHLHDAADDTPAVFAPGVVSTDAIEYGPAFAPDGRTLYFTRRASWQEPPALFVSHFRDGAWQAPEKAPFSGVHGDEYPAVSPDGRRVYFASVRPVAGGEAQERNDLWYVEREGDGWGTPVHLGGTLSTPGIESHPLVTADGTLYFHSNRPGGAGRVDIYRAAPDGDGFAAPEPVAFNSPATDGELCFDPRGRFGIFYSEREGTLGRGDLWVVRPTADGWTDVRNLGPAVNTADYEWTPTLSPDGDLLVYAHLAGDVSNLMIVRLAPLLR